jgi:ATP-dependent RNA helicase DDX3X
MVTTGLAARGIDIKNVMHVFNYDLPSAEHGGIQEYVHRIGRTARIGHAGIATSLYNERNEDIAADLVKILMETGQDVPDFLEDFKPVNGALEFSDNESVAESDEEEGAADGGEAGVWGEGGAPVGDTAVADGFKPDGDSETAIAGDTW